jgi:hypothetical protein
MAIGSQGQYTIVIPQTTSRESQRSVGLYAILTTASRSSAWSEKPSLRCNQRNDEMPVQGG